jgi:predicted deoxyguanosinetriphosphate triphosphohydrolase
MRSSASRGRVHSEAEHAFRLAFQRDRDRIIHCSAFRRLEYKTQVFVNHEGDYFRTRLTHTMETAQIARTLARVLRLNEDLCEAIAYAHDLGHTPFGHVGEAVLDEGAAQNDVQLAEEPDSSKYPVGPRLGCSPRLVYVPNVMDRERSSKILAHHAEDEEAFKRPGKSSYASPKESMTEHTSDSQVKENTQRG